MLFSSLNGSRSLLFSALNGELEHAFFSGKMIETMVG